MSRIGQFIRRMNRKKFEKEQIKIGIMSGSPSIAPALNPFQKKGYSRSIYSDISSTDASQSVFSTSSRMSPSNYSKKLPTPVQKMSRPLPPINPSQNRTKIGSVGPVFYPNYGSISSDSSGSDQSSFGHSEQRTPPFG